MKKISNINGIRKMALRNLLNEALSKERDGNVILFKIIIAEFYSTADRSIVFCSEMK